jgi:FixJ family two-component response regulator
MDDFMSKPYSQDELQRVLQRWSRRDASLAAAG